MKSKTQFAVGIDLGTTNSVIAYTAIGAEGAALEPPEVLPIPQLVAPSTVEPRDALPSFLYLATDAERSAAVFDVPGAKKGRDYAVGQFAQKQPADVPTRSVAGAKSWLAYSRVDRRSPILPWNAPADSSATRVSQSGLSAVAPSAVPADPANRTSAATTGARRRRLKPPVEAVSASTVQAVSRRARIFRSEPADSSSSPRRLRAKSRRSSFIDPQPVPPGPARPTA